MSGDFEQTLNEFDLVSGAPLFVTHLVTFDGSNCLDTAKGRFGHSQGPEAGGNLATVSQRYERSQSGCCGLSVDMSDAVKMWVVSVNCFADGTSACLRLSGAGPNFSTQAIHYRAINRAPAR